VTFNNDAMIASDSGTLTLSGDFSASKNATFAGAGNIALTGGGYGAGNLTQSGTGTPHLLRQHVDFPQRRPQHQQRHRRARQERRGHRRGQRQHQRR
jgi:hypothetical protein